MVAIDLTEADKKRGWAEELKVARAAGQKVVVDWQARYAGNPFFEVAGGAAYARVASNQPLCLVKPRLP